MCQRLQDLRGQHQIKIWELSKACLLECKLIWALFSRLLTLGALWVGRLMQCSLISPGHDRGDLGLVCVSSLKWGVLCYCGKEGGQEVNLGRLRCLPMLPVLCGVMRNPRREMLQLILALRLLGLQCSRRTLLETPFLNQCFQRGSPHISMCLTLLSTWIQFRQRENKVPILLRVFMCIFNAFAELE